MKTLKFHEYIERSLRFVKENCPYRQGGDEGVFGLGSWKCAKECPHCLKRDTRKHIVKCNFRILDLSLTYHWYDEIESGRKCVEYRALNEFWTKRLVACRKDCVKVDCVKGDSILDVFGRHKCIFCGRFTAEKYDAVRFHRGRGGKQTMMFECVRILIAQGHVDFGAPEDDYVFNIYLGKRLQ